MALEGLGVASNVAGVVSLGLTVCHGLLKYYNAWKDAESDMRKMYSSVETLTQHLTALEATLREPCLDTDLVHRVKQSIESCKNGVECLEKKLKKINMTTDKKSGIWDAKIRPKLQRTLYPFKESTLVKLKETSIELRDNVQSALDILQLLQNLQIESSHISSGVAGLTSIQQGLEPDMPGLRIISLIERPDQHLSTIFRWLSPLFEDFENKQFETFNITARQDANCRSLINLTEFQKWTQSRGQILWCLGSSGVGKTVFASFVIDHLQTIKPRASGIAFIYGYYNDSSRQTIHNLIGVIIHQLAIQDNSCMVGLQQYYESHQKAGTHLSLTEYCELLRSTMGHFSNVCVVIDALDELNQETGETLLEKLGALRPDVSLLITSRHGSVSSARSQAESRLSIAADERDIKGYLEERLHHCKVLRAQIKKDSNLHEQIVSRVLQKAKGMFLLARLQLDSLMEKLSLRDIKKTLEELPEELDAMYDQALHRIEEQGPGYASLGLKIIRWVHHAARPLSLLEIRHALAVEVDDKNFDEEGLLDEELFEPSCAGLITIQEHGTVTLVHYTAQEYLSRKPSILFPGTHAAIASICLTYLCFEDFKDGPCNTGLNLWARNQKYPFLKYAAQHWAQHTRAIPNSDLDGKVLDFFAQTSNVESSAQAMKPVATEFLRGLWRLEHVSLNGLCLAAMHGLPSVCMKFLEQDVDVNAIDSYGYAPLHYATMYDHGSIVHLLLKADANLEIMATADGKAALHLAAWMGREGIVQQLLEKGAGTAAEDRLGFNALNLAHISGHIRILVTLLEVNNNIDMVIKRAKDSRCAAKEYFAVPTQCPIGYQSIAADSLVYREAATESDSELQQSALSRVVDTIDLETAVLRTKVNRYFWENRLNRKLWDLLIPYAKCARFAPLEPLQSDAITTTILKTGMFQQNYQTSGLPGVTSGFCEEPTTNASGACNSDINFKIPPSFKYSDLSTDPQMVPSSQQLPPIPYAILFPSNMLLIRASTQYDEEYASTTATSAQGRKRKNNNIIDQDINKRARWEERSRERGRERWGEESGERGEERLEEDEEDILYIADEGII